MDVDGYQALSDLERTQIEHTIEDDLVVHLYQSTRSGTAVAVFVSMVVFAFFCMGSRNSGMPFEIASIPVSAAQPDEKALRNRNMGMSG